MLLFFMSIRFELLSLKRINWRGDCRLTDYLRWNVAMAADIVERLHMKFKSNSER